MEEKALDKLVEQNVKAVYDYYGGEEEALNYLVGQVLQATGGSVDPSEAQEEIKTHLKDGSAEKALARRAYLKGYELGYGVEELKDINIKTANSRFERWWETNIEE